MSPFASMLRARPRGRAKGGIGRRSLAGFNQGFSKRESSMPTTCRPARLEDLDAVDTLVVSSINDLTERHGFGPMASRSPPRFQTSCLEDDPRGLWTAEDDGEIVGFAWSWACEDFWFLAQLFVQPGLQSGGIGRRLLAHALEHADAVGARNRALITFAFNTVSQGLYIQHG